MWSFSVCWRITVLVCQPLTSCAVHTCMYAMLCTEHHCAVLLHVGASQINFLLVLTVLCWMSTLITVALIKPHRLTGRKTLTYLLTYPHYRSFHYVHSPDPPLLTGHHMTEKCCRACGQSTVDFWHTWNRPHRAPVWGSQHLWVVPWPHVGFQGPGHVNCGAALQPFPQQAPETSDGCCWSVLLPCPCLGVCRSVCILFCVVLLKQVFCLTVWVLILSVLKLLYFVFCFRVSCCWWRHFMSKCLNVL